MKRSVNLISENILTSIIKLSIPILGTSFIQMAYNMIDMIWVGRLGSSAVAAIGTAGFFTWFGNSLVFVSKIGAEVFVSQEIGKDNIKEKNKFIYNSLFINIIIALVYTVIILIFKRDLIEFFKLGDNEIINMAIDYLVIIAIGMVFYFLNPLFTGIFNASGNSKIPFIINSVGLVFNIVFDPILIFGLFGLKPMGVIGAAIATVLAQIIVTILFIITFIRNGYNLSFKNIKYIDKEYIFKICKIGIPTALQNCSFAFFAMIIGRIVASWGAVAIAVQKVGSQIEAISWMTAEGFGAALTAFVGQNYGAKKYDRILKGYKITMIMSSIIGAFATILLIFFGESIFSIFIPEKEAIIGGASYLKILGISQIFMCIEITTAGAFSGLGNTITPSWVGIALTGARIPLALLLANIINLGIDGVWYSISITSIFKGILLYILFKVMFIESNKNIFKSLDKQME